MLDALVDPPGLLSPGTSAMQLDMDLAETVPEDLVASVEPERQPVVTLDPSMADLRLVVLAGPGVVRAGAVAALGDMCTRSGAGVFNTWGAKGVLRWDSPWHFGTIGLQQRDVELAELDGFDIVITTGLDPAELPQGALSRLVVQDVHPAQLRALCGSWSAKHDPPGERPRLYPEIAAALRPLYEDDSAPLSPARAALHLSGALPDAAMAVADAGQAGFWVARAFPTSIPNSVCVPARRAPGFAASAALVCELEGRGVLAVTDEEGFDAPETGAVLAFAENAGAPVALQVWRDSGPSWESSADHVNLIEAELAAERVRVDDVAVRFEALEVLEAVAGSVSAWTNS